MQKLSLAKKKLVNAMMKHRLFACGVGTSAIIVSLLFYTSTVSGQHVPYRVVQKMEKNLEIADETFAFASYYQNNMVLQREPNQAVIWGYGEPGATVNISVNIQDVYSTKVRTGFDKRGVWSVKIKPQPAGRTADIQGVHDNQGRLQWILLKNLLFGDVWVCSGQSNMQFTMRMAYNATEELEKTSNYPNIRIFTVAENTSDVPLYELLSVQQSWSVPSPETVGGPAWAYFSAVCWLYGRYLYDTLQIPIGLVATTWGGTPVEAWSSPAVLEGCGLKPTLESDFEQKKQNPLTPFLAPPPHQSSVLWNAMVHPLLNMTIAGAIWYQGEANVVYDRDYYQCLFPSMIQNWRKEWLIGSDFSTEPEFPFGFVQLASVNVSGGSFPIIRWHQTADYGYVPNDEMPKTFMAVAMDLPDNGSPYGSIHPRDKQDVAWRLVNGALSVAYGQTLVYDGPFPISITQSTDHKIVIQYSHYQQLVVSDKSNFQICCKSSNCDVTDPEGSQLWHDTAILSHSDHTITLSGKSCNDLWESTTKVRYAWALVPCDFKACSVYNTRGFPAAPFVMDVTAK